MPSIKKAIIPAAGFGTRHLPITKAVPKEMLPILDKPAIDYVVEECIQSGISEICVVVSRGKQTIVDYLDVRPDLEAALIKADKKESVKLLNPFKDRARFYFVRQSEMTGTAKAVELCREFIGKDDFAVLFPDDVMLSGGKPVTAQLIQAYEATGSTVVGVQRIPEKEARKYGVMIPFETKGRYTRIKGFMEKPTIDKLPSDLTSLGRFVLTNDIFDYIDLTPAVKGEVYLPSAIDMMAKRRSVYAYEFEGRRFDMGGVDGFLEANIAFALQDVRLGKKIKDQIEG